MKPTLNRRGNHLACALLLGAMALPIAALARSRPPAAPAG
jgi:hypothetical protein